MNDPMAMIQVSSVQLRDDGIIQINYAEPSQQSNRVTRMQIICFEADVVDHELIEWIQATEKMMERARFVQDEEKTAKLRPR